MYVCDTKEGGGKAHLNSNSYLIYKVNIIMRTSLKVGVVAAFAFVASATGAQAALNLPTMQCSYSFSTNMGIGARSTSVMDLQKVLNMYPETRVAVTGAGSAGMETSYFGPATRAAVQKFQAINNVLTTGFVGPLTLATLNQVCTTGGSMLPAGCSSTSGFSPITGISCASGTGTVVFPVGCTSAVGFSSATGLSCAGGSTVVSGSGLQVMAAANTGGTIIAGAAQVPVLNFKLMNGSAGEVTVNSIKFMKLGTVSDASIVNGYLSSGNQIVGQYTSLAQGVMTFANVNAKIPAGATVDMALRVDLAGGTSIAAGNLIGFQVMSASDVTISAGTVGGTFPLTGGNFYTTTVSNPALASIQSSAYQQVGTSVDAGTMSFRAGAVTFNVVNNPVKLQSVRFNVNGSINPGTDLANLKLRVSGQEVSTGVITGNNVYFDLGSNPRVLPTGNQLMEVYADVLGTPNRSFKMEILRPYDVVLMDTQYNTNISFGTPSGLVTATEVRKGTATVTLASDTPTGTIPLGGSNVTLGKFRVFASGEALRIKFLPFTLTQTSSVPNEWLTLAAVDADIRNIALYGDDGVQVGTTINTPSGCSFGPGFTATTYTCSFGTNSANINYTIPANTSRVLSLKADIQNTANFNTIRAQLNGAVGNVEGQISFQSSNLPGGIVPASILSLTTAPFQATLNGSLGTQTIVGGAMNQRIGSFSLSASSAEGVDVTSVRIQTAAGVGSNALLRVQNLVVKVDGTSWNFIVGTVDPSVGYVFTSPSGPLRIPAGGSKTVDVFADVLTGSIVNTYAPILLTDAVANGVSTNSNQTLRNSSGNPISTNNITGQSVTVATAGTASVTVDTSIPPAQQLVLGAVGATLGQFRLTATNNEDIRVDQVTVTIESMSGTGPATFKNLRLFDGTTEIGMGTAVNGTSPTFTSLFTIPNGGIVIAKNGTKTLTVKGDIATFTESPLSNNQAYTIRIAVAGDVRAFGQASNETVIVGGTFPLVSNVQTSLRTKVTAALTPMGSTSARARTAADDVAKLTLNADSAFNAEFRGVTLSLSGAALLAGQTIELVDDATGVTLIGATGLTGATVILNPTNPDFITAGGSKVYRIRVNTGSFVNAANTSDSFSIQIVAAANLRVREQGGAADFGLETRAVPLTSTVSYE